jgi:hypothetical protein
VIEPRLRQRVEVVPVRPGVKIGVTNAELVESFLRMSKLSEGALASYRSAIRDFVRYMKHPDGREISAREWTKDAVWAYLHFVEANYCAHFRSIPLDQGLAVCRKKVFTGVKSAELAVAENCRACPLFKTPQVAHRVNGLSKFFKFLAKVGAIPVNFMADVVTEWWDENPIRDAGEEKRRNPSVEEERKLVNGTAHPMRRAYYAASAKWWYRPNEMFALDRYASFGAKVPAGLVMPEGFDDGFGKHQDLKPFEECLDLFPGLDSATRGMTPLPIVTTRSAGGEAVFRAPMELNEWAYNAVAIAQAVRNPFPARVRFERSGGRYSADVE